MQNLVEDMLFFLHDNPEALNLLTGFCHEFSVSGTTMNLVEAYSILNRYPSDAEGVPERRVHGCGIYLIGYPAALTLHVPWCRHVLNLMVAVSQYIEESIIYNTT